MTPIAPENGLLCHLVRSLRPDLADVIAETGRVETAVIGLGGQGTRHAGLMSGFGTCVAGGIAPGRGGEMIHESIPVYDSVRDCLGEHPHLAAVSIWRHFSSARDAALEAIEAGVPIVVLITEGIPLRDVRDVIAAARAGDSLMLGGNTPGAIFPPERIKVGMLPDVFYPAEPKKNEAGASGVTILSRSGAILYHMSDALASAGIAQNGVIGVGGDGAIGSTFRDLVPLVMAHDATDLVVVAGEIGGGMEENFAADIAAHPEKYPKRIVALISGAHAPAGKTMGHAGAIVTPGQAFGTYVSKRAALEAAGVTVVNSQYDLIEVVREALGGKTYFDSSRYYDRMRLTWEAQPQSPAWGTLITGVAPNRLTVAGYPLEQVIRRKGLLEAAHLLVALELPSPEVLAEMEETAAEAARQSAPAVESESGEELSTVLARLILTDGALRDAPWQTEADRVRTTARAIGRMIRFIAVGLGTGEALDAVPADADLRTLIARAVGAAADAGPEHEKLIEVMATASVDHGVTPPSAQATILAATVRPPFAMGLAAGVGAITDVHGGAGARAAAFFSDCIRRAEADDLPLTEAAVEVLLDSVKAGERVAGLGHRVHTEDPRRDVLWEKADEAGVAAGAVEISKGIEDVFEEVRGFRLPINVDGVIGAVVADLALPPIAAKALFILGRTAGLSAHFFEETRIQPPMRRIRFDEAAYRGPAERNL